MVINIFTVLDKDLVLNFIHDPQGFAQYMSNEAMTVFNSELGFYSSKVEEGPTSQSYVFLSALKSSQEKLTQMLTEKGMDVIDLKIDSLQDGIIRLSLSMKEGTYVPPSQSSKLQ